MPANVSPGSVSAPNIDEQNPWPGLAAFDEADERFFNGRREESTALRRLVLNAPLAVVFGGSGLGKTSLLQAGLFPLLRKEVLPVHVRLDFQRHDAPLIEQVKVQLESEVRKWGVEAPPFLGGESLWEFLHRSGLELWSRQNQLLTPLFVLDQFEEVFTLGAGFPAAIAQLRTDLADLIENRVPAILAARLVNDEHAAEVFSFDSQRYKVLFSFREDYLPQMEAWKGDIPSIMRNRLRLLPMSGEQAFEAVHRTAPNLAPEPVARQIVAFVAAAGDAEPGAEVEVAPALLSLVCAGLNQRRRKQGKSQFDESLVAGTGNEIVADFYRNAVSGVPARVRRFVENELITERGFRKPCDIDDARMVHGVSDADLSLLVNRRLLHLDPARGTLKVELTHDLLTRVVREERDRQRELDRRAKERKERRRLTAVGVFLGLVALAMGSLYYYANVQKQQAQAALDEVTKTTKKALNDEKALEQQRIAAGISQATAAVKERVARSNELAGAAIAKLNDGDPIGGIGLALEAIEATRGKDNTILATAEGALRRTAFARTEVLDRPGHKNDVRRIELSPDAKRVATSGIDGVKIWDVARAHQLHSFSACSIHEFSQDWKKLACSDGYAADFWDVDANRVVEHIARAHAIVREVGFSPDGKYTLWEANDETHVSDGGSLDRTFEGLDAVFSANGKILATVVPGRGFAGAVKVWDVDSGQERRSWGEVESYRTALSPDGKIFARSDLEYRVHLLDVTSGKDVTLNSYGNLGCMAFNADGSRLAVLGAGFGFLVDLFSANMVPISGNIDRPDDPRNGPLPPHQCRFTPDGSALYFERADGSGMLDLETGRTVVRAMAPHPAFNDSEVYSDARSNSYIEFSQDSKPLAVAAFSPDRKSFATSGENGVADVWDVASKRLLATLSGNRRAGPAIYVLAYSPDGTRIATGAERGEAKLWDAQTGQLLHDFPGHRARILSVGFSADGKRVLTSGNDHQLFFWDASTAAKLPVPATPNSQTNLFGLAFSANGKRLALAGDALSIRDPVSWNESLRTPGNLSSWEEGLTLSHDGQLVAAVGPSGVDLLRLGGKWKHLPGTVGGMAPLPIQIAFSRDGRRLVTPGTDHTIKIWDTESDKEPLSLYYEWQTAEKEEIKIKAIIFSPDEREVFAVGDNWSLFRFPVHIDDLISEAKKRVSKH